MELSVIGLGKLGLCTAACFARQGFPVWGFDSNPRVMTGLEAGRVPISENGLEQVLADGGWERLHLAANTSEAVRRSAATFVIVPTPSLPGGELDNGYVEPVLEEIGSALAAKNNHHVVCIVSTVMPGSCSGRFLPLLEKTSGQTCGQGFGLVY
ncbi:MAG: hypothetical protein AB1896_07160, partial [Thermodesulfobacteriota bacterium]